jgi:hypothetical protein
METKEKLMDAMAAYLNCPCQRFEAMEDDASIMAAGRFRRW